MAWAWVQDDSFYSGVTPDNTAVKAFTSNVAAGSLIVVAVSVATNTETATCAGSRNGSFTLAVGPTRNGSLGGSEFSCWIFFFPNSAAGSETVTVTFSASLPYRRLNILEYSGIATSSALDGSAENIGATGTADSGSDSTSVANELIFGYGLQDAGDITAGTGFTPRTEADGYDQTEDKNGVTAGSYNATFGGSSARWIAQMATFKQPAEGGVVTGTATASITEADVVTGGKEIIITLTGDTFIA
jgi:hypothetical protein